MLGTTLKSYDPCCKLCQYIIYYNLLQLSGFIIRLLSNTHSIHFIIKHDLDYSKRIVVNFTFNKLESYHYFSLVIHSGTEVLKTVASSGLDLSSRSRVLHLRKTFSWARQIRINGKTIKRASRRDLDKFTVRLSRVGEYVGILFGRQCLIIAVIK